MGRNLVEMHGVQNARIAPAPEFRKKKVSAMKSIACSGFGLVLLLGAVAGPAFAQDQAPANQPSDNALGDYARQVRKAPTSKSKPKVFDNDNLPKDDKLSIVGQTPATTTPAEKDAKPADATSTVPASSDSKPASDSKSGTDAKPAGDQKTPTATTAKPADEQAAKEAAWKQWGDNIAAQKNQIDMLTRELEVSQREYQIRAAAMYGDAGNRLRNQTDWDKQDTQYKQQLADKQKALDEAKQKLEDMQEEARKAGVPSSIREP
jgi:hypothetical protein